MTYSAERVWDSTPDFPLIRGALDAEESSRLISDDWRNSPIALPLTRMR